VDETVKDLTLDSKGMKKIFSSSYVGLISIAISLAAATSACATSKRPSLEVAVESNQQIWNAVVHVGNRTFMSGPRWTGSTGPQLNVIDKNGERGAFPNLEWNNWITGKDASHSFVNINALRLEGNKLWVVDTGSPDFGGNPVKAGAKLVCIDLVENRVVHTYYFPTDVAKPGSYVDDVRFHKGKAFLTDAGHGGIIVLDLESGISRRVLENHPSVTASTERNIVLSHKVVRLPNGSPLRVNSDPLEISQDGYWLYFGALQGPWYKVRTDDLVDTTLSPQRLAASVEPFADIPPTGGSVMDAKGNLYFSDLANDAFRVRHVDGTIETLIVDKRLHWVDAPFLDREGGLWLPTPQMDRTALFNNGKSQVQWPIRIYHLAPSTKP
jgi:hypothetical protein